MIDQSKAELIQQLRAAIAKAEKLEREAWARGDAQAFQSYQTQANHLRFKLEQAKQGAYKSQ